MKRANASKTPRELQRNISFADDRGVSLTEERTISPRTPSTPPETDLKTLNVGLFSAGKYFEEDQGKFVCFVVLICIIGNSIIVKSFIISALMIYVEIAQKYSKGTEMGKYQDKLKVSIKTFVQFPFFANFVAIKADIAEIFKENYRLKQVT
jgi:hypothetical protein